ncbi:hypothetical protein L7F22_063406 [Adiantum nelumboides]|nr:hypothetical protein [Adiantum nelumboides]
MGVADTAADQKLPKEREARAKAAAWAWYQRSAGSVAPGAAGKSEAFASRCTARLSPSRFQREAAMRASLASDATLTSFSSSMDKVSASLASDATLTSFSSSMDKVSGSSSFLMSHDIGTARFSDTSDQGDLACIDAIPNTDQDIANVLPAQEQPSLDLVLMDPAACWDCGSSLFDSFELVAMSKKLDAELCESLDGQLAEDMHTGFDLNQHKVLAFYDAPPNAVSPQGSPPPAPHQQEPLNKSDIFDKLISAPDKQSKQAVYDMFCQYGDTAKHVTKQTCKRSPPADVTCGGEAGKPKLRKGRMSFHGLAKAIHSIKHLHLHATSGGGGGGHGDEDVQDHHHHHHLHYSPQPHAAMSGKAIHAQGQPVPTGDPHAYDDAIMEGSLNKSSHIHHHHHHHYHYLFHSSEEDIFRIPALDKSLKVAAAGLRSSKVSPVLSSYLESPARGDFPVDFGRKWAEFGGISSPNFQY